jgi:hypothetical protein
MSATFSRFVVAAVLGAALASSVHAAPKEKFAAFAKEAKTAITADFLDPQAAQFRRLFVSDVVSDNGTKIRYLCGEVNGKNSYGAYIGYRRFYSVTGNIHGLMHVLNPTEDLHELFEERFERNCANKIADVQ